MSDAELLSKVDGFTATGELDALFLMTMHTFDFERLDAPRGAGAPAHGGRRSSSWSTSATSTPTRRTT